jgi:hypothetical protein
MTGDGPDDRRAPDRDGARVVPLHPAAPDEPAAPTHPTRTRRRAEPRRAARRSGPTPVAPVRAVPEPVTDEPASVGTGADPGLPSDWEAALADALAFLRRRLTGDYAVDEFGFDPELTERVLLALLRPIYRRWFRVELRGADRIPAERGALLVGNHSGTLAWDALMTQVAVHEATDGRFLRLLGADLVFATPVMGDVARRMGATLAANSDAERLLSSGQLVGV